jgi:hypothetical protein
MQPMKRIARNAGMRRPQRAALRLRAIEVLEPRALLADGITPSPGPPITATAGVPITNAVFATYTLTDASGEPGTQWRALIHFGDGQSDFLVIPIQTGDVFEFEDTHTYQAPGVYNVTVMIAMPGSHNAFDNSVTTQVTVTPSTQPPRIPHLSGSGLAIHAHRGRTFHGPVARFRLMNSPGGGAVATIAWGDQSAPSAGQIRARGGGRFVVAGSHVYSSPGTYHMIVQIQDSAGQEVAVASIARVMK